VDAAGEVWQLLADISGQFACLFIQDQAVHSSRTAFPVKMGMILSRNVGNQLPTSAVQNPQERGPELHQGGRQKPRNDSVVIVVVYHYPYD
jgi:hypothetical protein